MASSGFPDFQQHYLALTGWVDHGKADRFNGCRTFVRQRVPCKIADGPGSQDLASTLLLGRSWTHWSAEQQDQASELLDLYELAGYVDGARLLGPVGAKDAQLESGRPTRRLPLASAMHFRNTDATVLLLDRGLLHVTDVRPAIESFVREHGTRGLTPPAPELKADEAFAHFAALLWGDDPAGLARVTAAIMRHRFREQGAAPAAQGDVGSAPAARRAARASI